MDRLPLGLILLVAVSILIYFGLAHRLLDRMRLTDKAALGVVAALIVGSFIDIPIMRDVSVNVGGGLVPIALAVYLLIRAGTAKEWLRALFAAAATTGVIYFLGSYVMRGDPGEKAFYLDPLYIYPLVGGLVAYLLGRSRRAAFIAGTLGVLGLDIVHWVWLGVTNTPGTVNIGGAGAFDSIVVAGLAAILLAEIIGETRERLQGGPQTEGRDPELIKNLKEPDSADFVHKTEKDRRNHTDNEKKTEGEDK